MLGIAIDALALMVLLKTINDEDIGFGTSIVVALVASVGTTVLAIGLAAVMGIAGIAVAAIIAAVLLGGRSVGAVRSRDQAIVLDRGHFHGRPHWRWNRIPIDVSRLMSP